MAELRIDKDRLVDWASRAIGIPSFTGSEEAMAELMRETFLDLGLRVQWQQVEDGRANVLGTRGGVGGGPSLMFNGHMDTSYSGREPWLAHVPGFQPSAFVEDGRLYGLGISNMKGALACYVEALRALTDAGVQLRGDVMIAAVSGEIEKTQYGDAQGAEYRGYAAGSRYLVSHGGVADMCILGAARQHRSAREALPRSTRVRPSCSRSRGRTGARPRRRRSAESPARARATARDPSTTCPRVR